MKGAIITALGLFIFLWVMVVNHPKETQTEAYDETYIKSITEYNNHRYEAQNGPEVVFNEIPEVACACEYTDAEIQLMVRLAMSEAGKLDVDAIQAVVQTAMNRVKSDDYPDNITDVIYQKINGHRQFSTADNGDPNEKCYTAVENAIAYPEAFPTDMYWFNSDHVPNYGHYYTEIDGMYFSTVTDYNAEVIE